MAEHSDTPMAGTPPFDVVFPGDRLAQTRALLLADHPDESAAFLLAHPVTTLSGGTRLLVYDHVPVAANAYASRSPIHVTLTPAALAAAASRAREEGAALVVAHSHAHHGPVGPSDRDREGETHFAPALARRVAAPLARLIVGHDDVHAAALTADGNATPARVISVGRELTGISARPTRVDVPPELYDRQVRAFGAAGQMTLSRLRVGIVGLGGTGSVVAQQLAHLGVGALLLIDSDCLETTNLNRVVGARPSDVGRPKVAVAEDMIRAIHPAARVTSLVADVQDAPTVRRLLDVDCVVNCTDSHGSRAVVNQLAYQYVVPAFDLGVVIHPGHDGTGRLAGRVQMLAPGLPCLICGNVLDPEAVRRDLLSPAARAADPYVVGSLLPTPQPAVISLNSVAASLAVTMLLAAVTGVPGIARHQRLRLESGVVTPVEGTPQPACPVCSSAGASGRGDAWPAPGRALVKAVM